ncbi:MAG: SDR family NAD(P)-dependent oxidoreductase [Myxococcota bacterium]
MSAPTPSRVLVTGCAGFIGSHLCEHLMNAYPDVTVVGVDALTPYYDPRVKRQHATALQERSRFTFVEGDIRDTAVLRQLVAAGPYSHVVHLAGEVGVRPSLERPADYFSVNCTGTAQLLEAFTPQQPPPHMVLASSSSVYGSSRRLPFHEDDPCAQPVSPYAASKRAMELLASSWAASVGGPRITCLRFFTVYGPRQRPDMAITNFARRMLTQQPIALFDPDGSGRDYTYVGDVVEGIRLAMLRPTEDAPPAAAARFRVYNIGSGEQVTLREMVRTLQVTLGARIYTTEVGAAAGDVERTWADLRRAEEELGYRPTVKLAEGLALSLEHLRQTVR